MVLITPAPLNAGLYYRPSQNQRRLRAGVIKADKATFIVMAFTLKIKRISVGLGKRAGFLRLQYGLCVIREQAHMQRRN